jgi:hypothetical protein
VLGAERAAEMGAMSCGERRFRHYVREKERSARAFVRAPLATNPVT